MQDSDQLVQDLLKMGTGFRNLATTLTLSLCFILRSYAASHYQQQQQKKQQLPYAMVVGSVYCNTCFQPDFSELSRSIPGASVEVKCDGNGKNKLWFQKQVKTDQHGTFRFRLPMELSRNVKEIETCSVKLVRSSRSICSMASPETSAGRLLRLRSRRHGVLIFSAGFVACNHESRPSVSAKYLLFPPLIPFLPPPPNIGGIPLPPNPLQPPPSIFPPLPFQPSPPPFSVVPPLPFQPPPPPFSIIPPLPNIPLLPFLVPPPPPPPPAFLFPPLPLPPFFPGHPPAASAQGTNK